MPDESLREEIKEMMVENLMLKVSKEEIADDLPLFGPGGLGLTTSVLHDSTGPLGTVSQSLTVRP